ncbi:type II secretion system F family protein [Planctomicrobium piriforme]|uniref:Type IV pilus assembly protein PilC n=1 Tax=Planctomicrobium piriforme TaxID=1576369 RepID=A0A1I3BDM7_9PLAN|nr:type II secretion system F family protein [Planctomicrobium piriforme]SFH60378.1 type IV pilus assembly protein PilC [Planctomicrobium piriforme]
MFSQRASMRELASLSRNLGVSLHSGIGIVKAFDLTSRKTTGRLHAAVQDIIRELKSGSDVTTALEKQSEVFPDLFIDMVQVGETTGNLPEVLKSLAEHYENNVRLRREFIGQITMPTIQLIVAVFVIAALICLLGVIGGSTGQTFDVLGWGLLGPTGAMIWLGAWAMGVASIVIGYKLVSTSLGGQKTIHRWLLSLPVIGHCLRSFAIARFSWGFSLTQGAGMPIEDSIDAALRATSNGAFIAAAPDMIADISSGENLTEAFTRSELFPRDFLEFVLVAEQSGTVPEALHRLSPQFEEDARRSLQNMAAAMSWAVWAAVAGFIIFIVFTIALWYIGMINELLQETNR